MTAQLRPDPDAVALCGLSAAGDVLEEVLKWMVRATPKNDRLAARVSDALSHVEKAERQLARRAIGW